MKSAAWRNIMRTRKPKLETAEQFLREAMRVVTARQQTHGEIIGGQTRIATLWNAWLEIRRQRPGSIRLDALDVTIMLQLMKIARTQSGNHNEDDDIDNLGYGAKAAEIRARTRGARR